MPTRGQLDEARALSLRVLDAVDCFNLQAPSRSRGANREPPANFLRRMNRILDDFHALHDEWWAVVETVKPFLLMTNANREPVEAFPGDAYSTAHEAVGAQARRLLYLKDFEAECQDEREFARLWEKEARRVPWVNRGLVARIELEYASAVERLEGREWVPIRTSELARKLDRDHHRLRADIRSGKIPGMRTAGHGRVEVHPDIADSLPT